MKLFYYEKTDNYNSAVTDSLILKSLSKLNIEANEVLRTPNGKPYVQNEGVFIGVTHTDKTVIVAVSNREFGIDAEPKNRAIKNYDLIAQKFFSNSEIAYIKDSTERFLELWVKREAYLKFLGIGIKGIGQLDLTALEGTFTDCSDTENIIFTYEE